MQLNLSFPSPKIKIPAFHLNNNRKLTNENYEMQFCMDSLWTAKLPIKSIAPNCLNKCSQWKLMRKPKCPFSWLPNNVKREYI